MYIYEPHSWHSALAAWVLIIYVLILMTFALPIYFLIWLLEEVSGYTDRDHTKFDYDNC